MDFSFEVALVSLWQDTHDVLLALYDSTLDSIDPNLCRSYRLFRPPQALRFTTLHHPSHRAFLPGRREAGPVYLAQHFPLPA